jgi:membrane fusion protein (multidrug efflux system)
VNLRELRKSARGRVALAAVAIPAGILLLAGIFLWERWSAWVSTDDAFIESRIVQVAPSIAGRVLTVAVEDNQHVQAGTTLVEIDPAQPQARLDAARADLALARAAASASRAALEASRTTTAAAMERAKAGQAAAEARVTEAEAEEQAAASQAEQARDDLARYAKLDSRSVSEQQRDLAASTSKAAGSKLEAARKNIAAARAAVGAAQGDVASAEAAPHEIAVREAEVAKADAAIEKSGAAVHQAEIDLAYCHITATETGRITRKTVQVGNYVQVGQIMFALVPDERWVIANFKETQLGGIRPGAEAEVRVDAYPDAKFRGHVDSLQSGSGSRFSLLPPENATGNYVKVVQRVPVKIVFDEQPDPAVYSLGPGMSVEPEVRIR